MIIFKLILSRNYRLYRSGNFCKRTWTSKGLEGANIPFQTKKSYCHMFETYTWLVLGVRLGDDKLMGNFRSSLVTYILDLLTREYSRLAMGKRKKLRFLQFSLCFIVSFICMCHRWSFNPEHGTTGVEGAHLFTNSY